MPDSRPGRPAVAMPFGAFYGRAESRSVAGGYLVATMEADPWREVEPHGHDEAHLVVVLEGLYLTSARGDSPLQPAGSVVFNPPGTVHRDRFEVAGGKAAGRFLAISISRDSQAEIADVGSLPCHPMVASGPEVRSTVDGLTGPGPAPVDLESRIIDLLAALIGSRTGAAPPWVEQARALIADRSAEPLTTRTIAQTLGVHPVYFARAFRRWLGMAPGEYLREQRLNRAAGLLRYTRLPLAEVALRCGFADQSHLTRHFGRRFGASPARFRSAE